MREQGLWIVEEWARMVGISWRVAVSHAETIRFNMLYFFGVGCLCRLLETAGRWFADCDDAATV